MNDMNAILSQIDQLPADRRPSMRDNAVWIICPYHSGGMERTQSCKITVSGDFKNSFFCFGCHETGHFNVLAKHYGLEGIDEQFTPDNADSFNFRHLKGEQTSGLNYRHLSFDWNKKFDWRTIPGWLMAKAGAKVAAEKSPLQDPRVIFPVTTFGEESGRIIALMNDPKRDKDGTKLEKSYINTKGAWKSQALFGYDLAHLKRFKKKPLWINEGPRDVLHTFAADCRSVGLIGSYLTSDQAELIRALNPPHILIGTDGDDAGDKAAESVEDELGGIIDMTRIKWGKGKDPLDHSRKKIAKITKRFT